MFAPSDGLLVLLNLFEVLLLVVKTEFSFQFVLFTYRFFNSEHL